MNLDPDKLRERIAIEFSMIEVLSIHGNLCLALRHPQNAGAARQTALDIVAHLSKIIVHWGVMTQVEMDQATRMERQSGSLNS
jgi:hypothetical protein